MVKCVRFKKSTIGFVSYFIVLFYFTVSSVLVHASIGFTNGFTPEIYDETPPIKDRFRDDSNVPLQYDEQRGLYYRKTDLTPEGLKMGEVLADDETRIIVFMAREEINGSLMLDERTEVVVVFEDLFMSKELKREGFSFIDDAVDHQYSIKWFDLNENELNAFYENYERVKSWVVPKEVGLYAKNNCINDYNYLLPDSIEKQQSRPAKYNEDLKTLHPLPISLTLTEITGDKKYNINPQPLSNILYAAGILYDCQIYDLRSCSFFMFQNPRSFIESIKMKWCAYRDKNKFNEDFLLSLSMLSIGSFFYFWPKILGDH